MRFYISMDLQNDIALHILNVEKKKISPRSGADDVRDTKVEKKNEESKKVSSEMSEEAMKTIKELSCY